MIECELRGIRRRQPSGKIKVKNGLYSRCMYHSVPGFGKKNWVVVVNIEVDYDTHASEGRSLEEITAGCIEYLNTPPKSKYGKRRKRNPLYGIFKEEPYRTRLKEKNDKKYIQALLVVADRKRKCFWGEGERIPSRK